MSGIKAIETRYKGYHFRSRLEARWAVFFDTLGIEWAYEEEGFESRSGDKYLPDFRIGHKTFGLFAEVKGDSSQLTKNKNKLNEMHDYGGFLPKFSDSQGKTSGLILLGDIPDARNFDVIFHPIVQHRKGVRKSWICFNGCSSSLIPPVHVTGFNDDICSRILLNCSQYEECDWDTAIKVASGQIYMPIVNSAYSAARSARFEHGQNGAT